MALPQPARQRVAQPLRNASPMPRPVREVHTVPVSAWAWDQHAAALANSLEDLARLMLRPVDNFDAIRNWVGKLLDARRRVASLLFALEPFVPFDGTKAGDLLRLLDNVTKTAAEAVEGDAPLVGPAQELRDAASWWSTRNGGPDDVPPAQAAFGMPTSPLDEYGEFRADWVLQHYAYNNGDLLLRLLPHLSSLGVPHVTDVLAAVSIIGWILGCDDPVAGYVAMDMFLNRYLAADPDVATKTGGHLEGIEPALRRARKAASRAYSTATAGAADVETRALALADVYKRVVEGPFRQFSWALYCLRNGAWEAPPMLGNLRERLAADGGNLSAIVRDVVVPGLRNSEAHETLVWDGFTEEFITENGRVGPSQVQLALVLGDSFVRGCEAGLAAARAGQVQPDERLLPSAGETGRMPSWRRVQAFFGTNRLRLTEAELNARHAHLRVQRLAFVDINPCFQALVLARRLLSRIETFSVSLSTGSAPLIVVSSDALDATMPVWEYAICTVDQMPLATFLPANLNARSRVEPAAAAVRSVAWIAADDAVGAIDGSPDYWDDATLQLLDARLRIVEMAVQQTALCLPSPSPRLESVLASVRGLREWMAADSPHNPSTAEGQHALMRLRMQWERWGPVLRHPLIPEAEGRELSGRQPSLRRSLESMAFRTL
jgi:hypothetical protein